MGRRQQQRAARKDAACACDVAEHPDFDAPQRAEDAATLAERPTLPTRADMCEEAGSDVAISVNNLDEIHDAWESVNDVIDDDDSQTLSDLVMKIVDSRGVEEDVDNIREIVDHYNDIDLEFKAAHLSGLLYPLVQKVNSADRSAPKGTYPIMVVQKKWPKVHGLKVLGTEGTQRGTKEPGTVAMGLTGILGTDLGGMRRQPKPRSANDIDEIKWSTARQTALSEVSKDFNVPYDVEEYYSKMCSVGQFALVNVVHTKTQAIYDATMSNLVKRQNKKCYKQC